MVKKFILAQISTFFHSSMNEVGTAKAPKPFSNCLARPPVSDMFKKAKAWLPYSVCLLVTCLQIDDIVSAIVTRSIPPVLSCSSPAMPQTPQVLFHDPCSM